MRVSFSLLASVCVVFTSCAQSKLENSQNNPTFSNKSKATVAKPRPDVTSVEGLQQIAAQLRLGMENADVDQILNTYGLRVICISNSGVSVTRYFGAAGLFDPVIKAEFRRKSFKAAYLREWIVEGKAIAN